MNRSSTLFSPDPLDPGTSRLTLLYVLALSAVALLSIAGQFLVQYSLQRQLGDSTVVNIAGRQRMLGQKLTKSVLAYQLDANPETRAASLHELEETLAVWKHCHEGLQKGDPSLGLPNANSSQVRSMFLKLQPVFVAIANAATEFAALAPSDDAPLAALRATIVANEPKFLAGMDAIVKQYEDEARQRVAWLRRIEAGLLATTLVVLLLEGFFVFRPAVSRIASAVSALRATGVELLAAKEAAEAANKAKSRFLANISHELRTPLHAVLGMNELALATSLTPQQREFLETIDDSAQSLLGLMNELLDMAAIEAGKFSLERSSFSLSDLSHKAVTMLSATARRKDLALVCELSPGLPALVIGDSSRLRQVLVNLLNNGIKFTEAGSVRLRVTRESSVTAEQGGLGREQFHFEVQDTGIGIPSDQQARIFERFTQVDGSARREFGGVGLGLAICDQLVQRMGGRLTVESCVGKGSTFSFTLPLEVVPASSNSPTMPTLAASCPPAPATQQDIPAPTLPEQTSPNKTPTAQHPLHVLVAEDAESNRRVVSELLQLHGFKVTLACDGREAFELRQQQTFDLIFMDQQMPRLDGLAAVRKIREFEQANQISRVPIIALSADAVLAGGKPCHEWDMDGFVQKPARSVDLLRAIQSVKSANGHALPEISASNITTTQSVQHADAPAAIEGDRWARVIQRIGGRRELLKELAQLFNAEAFTLYSTMRSAVQKNDADVLRVTAHRLKGQAANFEAQQVQTITSDIENAALQQDFLTSERLLNELEQPLQALVSELHELV